MKNNDHFQVCDLCGQSFDLRILAEVVEHFHQKEEIKIDPSIRGVRVDSGALKQEQI